MQRRWSDLEAFVKLRCVPLRGHVDDQNANVVIAQLLYHASDDARSPVTMLIDSCGGVVTSALAIVETMRDVAPEVRTCAWGECTGTATLILAAGAIGRRSCVASTMPSIVPLTMPSHQSLDPKTAREVERLVARQQEIFVEHTQLTPQLVARAFEVGLSFTSDDARDLGIVDAVIDERSLPAAVRELWSRR